jgi:tetratricopeptide (TPR) repeat protein
MHGIQRKRAKASNTNRSSGSPAALSPKAVVTAVARRRRLWAAEGILIICGLAAYANSLAGEFVFDDYHDIVENSEIRRLWPLWRTVVVESAGGLSVHPRPFVVLSFVANYALGGMQAWHFHVVNVTVHILAGLTLFGIARRTLLLPKTAEFAQASTGLALLIALVWTLHPLQTQAVTYIVQRYESMMGLFYLLTLYTAIRAVTGQHARLWAVGSWASCMLAMGCKEVAISAPIIVLLYDRTFVAGSFREAWRRHGGLHVALASTWLLFVPFFWAFAGGQGVMGSNNGIAGFATRTAWYDYALTQPGVVVHYLRLCFWPRGQCFRYDWPIAQTAAQIIPPLLVIGGLLVATAWALAHRPMWGFLGAWFFLILAPTSSVIPIYDVAFEHRMYLSLAAVATAVVMCSYELWRRWSASRPADAVKFAQAPVALAAAAVAALGIQTMLRNEFYRSQLALFRDAVENAPHAAVNHLEYALALHLSGLSAEACEEVDRAIAIDPTLLGVHKMRGIVLARMNRDDEALVEFAREEELHPDNASNVSARGKLHYRRGRFADAVKDYTRMIELAPLSAEGFANRGLSYQQLGQHASAIADFDNAIDLDPRRLAAWWYRGASFAALGRHDRAIADLTEALRLDPKHCGVYRDRAASYLALGDRERAAADVRTVEKLSGHSDADLSRTVEAAARAVE